MMQAHNSTPESDMIGAPRELSKSGFAKLIGVTPGRVSQMVTAGLPVEANGKIDIARGKVWVSENINPTRSNAQAQGSFALGDDKAKISLTAEKARLAKEQADAATLRNAALRRELVPAGEVEREWSATLLKLRSAILAVPSRVRQFLPHLTPHDVQALDAELRRVLEDLANDQ